MTRLANHLRRCGRSAGPAIVPDVEYPAGALTVEAIDVSRALDWLTERQRVAVALFYYCGLRTRECGEVMGCSAGTVKSTLSDARAALRVALGEDYQ